jgi:hypothetical protein
MGTHDDKQWRRLKAKFRADCRARNALCHLCVRRGDFENAQIDYTPGVLSPWSFEGDHIRSWRDYPHLRYEWANLAASHSRCNRQRRADAVEVAAPEQRWVKPDW